MTIRALVTPTSHMAEALSRERVVMWRTQTRRLAAADGEIERARASLFAVCYQYSVGYIS